MPPLRVTWICTRVITYHMCCLFTSLWVFPTVSMWETGFYLNSSILWSGTCESAKGAKGHDLSWVLSSCSWWGDVISADPWPSSPAADFYLRCILVMKCHVTTLNLSGFSLFVIGAFNTHLQAEIRLDVQGGLVSAIVESSSGSAASQIVAPCIYKYPPLCRLLS